MPFRNKANLGYSAVATAPSPASSGTTLTVSAGHGSRFPASNFYITVWATGEIPTPTNAEILLVATRTGDVFSGMTRAQGGTSARAIVVGDQVANTVTAEQLTEIETAIPSTLGLLSAINVSAGVLAQNLSALTFSNANGISFGLAASVLTATVGTNYQTPGAYLTTAALSQDSSKYAGTNGAITGGSITVNTSGVSVNLPAYLSTQSTQFQALTLGGNTAGTTTFHATNNASLFLNGGNNITLSGNGSTVTISAANQSVQTQNLIAASLSGNTAGVLALVSSGTVIFAGGNNITLSQNGQSVTISGANVGGAQTGISGIAASNTTYTSGSVTFTGVGGGVTVSSNTGQRIDISVAAPVAQTVQTQNVHNLSLSGNTAGVLAQISSGTAILAGGNNITLSQNGQSITISGANVGGAQTGISGLVVSDTTYTSGTVSFSNAGNITISSSVNGATQYVRLSVAAQTNSSMTVSDAATSGTLARLAFTNLNGVTLSLSTGAAGSHTIVGSHNAITSQSTQFLALTLGGNTAGTTTFHATNNASLFLNGGNNITLSGNGSTVTISAAAQTNQSAIKGFGASNTGNTAGNTGLSTGIDWVLAGSNNITISQSTAGGGPNTLWVSGPTVGGAQTGISGIVVSDTTYTSGTVSFSNAGNITISSSVNGATQYIKLSGNAAQTVQTQSLIQAIYDGANSITTGTIRFTNANGVSFSINGQTLSGSVAAQTNQTIGGYAVGNTTGQSSSSTFDARTLSFNGAGNVSVGYSNSSIIISGGTAAPSPVNFSAGTTSGNLGSVVFSDSNGVSFGINGSTITATVSTYNTIGTATTVYSVASANSVGTVTRWAAEDHRHAGVGGIGISTSGNTAGTTGSVLGTYWFQGGNNITVSQITSNNGSHTLVLSGANAGMTNLVVSAGTTQTSLSSLVFSNSNLVSFGLNGSTITGSIPAPATASMWPHPFPMSTAVSTYYSGSTSQGAGGASTQTGYTFSLYAVPMIIPVALAFSELRIGVSNTRSTAGTGSVTHLYSIGFYTNNASTLSLVEDFYGGLGFTQNSITAQTFKLFTLTTGSNSVAASGGYGGLRSDGTVYSSAGNISANSQMDGVPGVKFVRVDSGAATTFTEGQYYCVLGFASASASVNVYANVGILQSAALSTNHIPDLGRENSTQTSNYLPAWGAISTTFTSVSNAATFFPLPTAIAISNLTMSNSSGQRFHFPYMRNNS